MGKSGSSKVVVIGAGPGGYAAAFMAADLGLEVSIIDKEETLGGVCLLRGCIPSKALLHAAGVITSAQEAASFGIDFGTPAIDLLRLRNWKEEVVHTLTSGLSQICKARKVNFIQGTATFLDSHTVSVESKQKEPTRLNFDYAIIATGSHPVTLPFLPVSGRVMDSKAALALTDIPKTLLVVGAGYIGLELGTVYSRLGSKVSVVEMTSDLLPAVDRELASKVRAWVVRHFESLRLNTKVVAAKETAQGLEVRIEVQPGKEVTEVYERMLVAVGRKPNASGLGLEHTSVTLDPHGFIQVDLARRTADPSLYAIGDVAGGLMLAHKASHEGKVAAESIAGKKTVFDPRAIPAVVFTDPEVAWCGITEDEAKGKGLEVEVAKFPWAASGRALTLGRTDGLTKLVIERKSQRIVGVGMAGYGCGELISEGVLAIEMGARVEDLALTIHPHPTLSETLMESAQVFLGTSASLFRPKRPQPGK